MRKGKRREKKTSSCGGDKLLSEVDEDDDGVYSEGSESR